ncbi:hypothetical protein [Luteimonas huabeiensis]|uniref:hypothetical protein n=1 Tax=Luteimonas huabeiensis TaxID=1244513 RepID=UPI000467CB58|nr:hypothetical protein [Luteimonas huabeiensis]
MPRSHPRVRTAVLVMLAIAVLGASGCRWFRKENALYAESPEARPLEVPPDLDRPRTDGAMALPEAPQSVSRSQLGAQRAPAASAAGFSVAGERDQVFARVGEALNAIEGVTIASSAQLLGSYDVSYQDASFLVRVSEAGDGVYVSAVDPRGLPAAGGPPEQLIAELRTRLGG